MSSFKNAHITDAGAEMLARTIADGSVLEFEKMIVGAGIYEETETTKEALQARTELKDQRQEFAFTSITESGNKTVKLKTLINNKNLLDGYRMTEIGVVARIRGDTTSNSVLYAIAIAEEADYLPEETTPITYIQEFYLKVENAENATISVEHGEYALAEDVLAIMRPDYEVAETLETPESGESIFTIFGKIKKAILTLIDHIKNKENPHKVTKEQIGLGKVSNVTTNDQTPTFIEASTLETLSSGEKMSTAFSKIAKAITDFISHITTKASSTVLGHVKLTDSSAVTDGTGYALPATEKNASISGTLANMISTLKKQYDEHNHDSSYYTKAETNTIETLNVANANPQVTVMAHTCKRNGHLLVFNIDINISADYEANTDLVYLPLNFEVGFASVKNTYYPDTSNNKNVSLYNDGNGFKIKTQETFAATYYSISGIAIV